MRGRLFPVSRWERTLLDLSAPIGDLPAEVVAVVSRGDDVILATSTDVLRVTADDRIESFASARSDANFDMIGAAAGRLLASESDANAGFRGALTVPPSFRVPRLTVLEGPALRAVRGRPVGGAVRGERVLVCRPVAPSRLSASATPIAPTRTALVWVDVDALDDSHDVAVDLGVDCFGACADSSGDAILVDCLGDDHDGVPDWPAHRFRVHRATEPGEPARELPTRWRSVSMIAPAEGGWLVSGAPVGDDPGVWHLSTSGALTARVRSHFVRGLAERGGRLYISHYGVRPAPHRLLAIPLEKLEGGVRFAPPSARELDPLARDAAVRLGLDPGLDAVRTRREEIEALCAVLDDLALDRIGESLGLPPEELDPVLQGWLSRVVPRASRAAAHALMVRCLLAHEGATWVDGARTSEPADSPVVVGNTRTLAIRPSILLDPRARVDVEISQIVADVRAMTAGRTLLLGEDPAALRAAAATLAGDSVAALVAEADSAALASLFERYPDNRRLRVEVYAELARLGRSSDLAELAAPRGRAGDSDIEDLRAWLAARCEGPLDEEQASRLVEHLRRAIRRFPREPSFHLLLGVAYRARGADHDIERARACFVQVTNRIPFGPVADHAREAYADLEEE